MNLAELVFDDVVFLANKNNDKFPKRGDFVYVYGVFRDLKIFYGNEYDLFLLVFRNISFFKLLVILKFFSTKSIIKREKEMFIFANMLKKFMIRSFLNV